MRSAKQAMTLGVAIAIAALLAVPSPLAARGKRSDPEPAPFAKGNGIDLKALNEKYRNALVRIEFTPIRNYTEIKLNPSKSEEYWGGNNEGAHGSGFFINQREIMTNAHVVQRARRGSLRIKSPATGNVEFRVEIVGLGSSWEIDLAILRIPDDELMRFKKRAGLEQIPTLELGDSSTVKQSDPLAILGYPEDSDELKIIQAEVMGRQYQSYGFGVFPIRHQFIEVGPGGVIQGGNSGGPAIDIRGAVVGIPTLGHWRSGKGWLIPSSIVHRFMARIRKSDLGKVPLDIPSLGLVLSRNFPGTSVWAGAPEDITIFELGVVVRDVIPKLQADQWGVKPGDIVVGFANPAKGISCALDFEGYCVVTGKMARWPADGEQRTNLDEPKIHLEEMVFVSDPGDDVKIWYIRPTKGPDAGKPAELRTVSREIHIDRSDDLPCLGIYDKPDFEMWGDFVAQDFNDFNSGYFDVPPEQVDKGGVIVTYVEPNSLASNRGLELGGGRRFRRPSGAGRWYIIDEINGVPVRNLNELRVELRKAEARFEQAQKSPSYDPERKILLLERYVQISVRTAGSDGKGLRLTPAFPIDEALECTRESGKPPPLPTAPESAVAAGNAARPNPPPQTPASPTSSETPGR